jgi:small ligand-binding sensory domain FIST
MSNASFLRAAQASGEHWGALAKSLLTALGPLAPDLNFGLAYVTFELAEDLSSIATFLRETTPIKQWTMAVADGLIGPIGAVRGRPALAVMVGRLPEDSFIRLDSWHDPARVNFLSSQAGWLARQSMAVALVHGDVNEPELPDMLHDLATATGSFVIGGATPAQAGGLGGVLLGSPLQMVTGLTQGCSPLGKSHQVTEAQDDVIMALDGRPALDVMIEEIGPELSRDLRQVAGLIHVGLPVRGADRPDYLVRPLMAIDPARGWLAVNARFNVGDPVLFVRRDSQSARKDMQRMLADVASRSQGRTVKGGIYISCLARGEQMFGSDDAESIMIKNSLGDFPLIGIISHGEFCHDRLYSYTGVLALILS